MTIQACSISCCHTCILIHSVFNSQGWTLIDLPGTYCICGGARFSSGADCVMSCCLSKSGAEQTQTTDTNKTDFLLSPLC